MKKGVKAKPRTTIFGWHPTWNAVVSFLLERDGYLCGVCKNEIGIDASVDHVIPRSRGGPDLLSNFRLVHRGCNASHFRKNFKSERKPQTEAHRKALSEVNKRIWAEIRSGIRPHPRRIIGIERSELNKRWWRNKSKEERAAIKKKAWETRRANR